MRHRIHLLAATVILAGAALLGHPAQARATYLNPLRAPAPSTGVVYCCWTGDDTHCCFLTGCFTKPGVCLELH
jgi:hypothetical protein